MKRTIVHILTLVLALSFLSGCTNTGSNSTPDSESGVTTDSSLTNNQGNKQENTSSNEESLNPVFGKPNSDVGVVLIINSNLGDKAICDLSHEGLLAAADEYGFRYKVVELGGDATKYVPTLQTYSDDPEWDLILCSTANIRESLQQVAQEFPEQKYILYDIKDTLGLPNIYSIEFCQNEGAFAVGVAAALLTKGNNEYSNEEKVVGFIGGAENANMDDFVVGYIKGVQYIDPEITVLVSWVGDFVDTAKAKELAVAQAGQGADVIFSCASSAGLGALSACVDLNIYSIGVGSDQYTQFIASSPEIAVNICTSAMKIIDIAVYDCIKSAMEGTLEWGGYNKSGVAEGFIGVADDNDNYQKMFTDEQKAVINEVLNKIKDKEIVVPTAFDMTTQEIEEVKASGLHK